MTWSCDGTILGSHGAMMQEHAPNFAKNQASAKKLGREVPMGCHPRWSTLLGDCVTKIRTYIRTNFYGTPRDRTLVIFVRFARRTDRKPTKVWTLYRPPDTPDVPFLDDGPLLDYMRADHFGRRAGKHAWESVERYKLGIIAVALRDLIASW